MLDGNKFCFADSNFLQMFSFAVAKGDKANLLANNTSIVLTQSLAQKLFGSDDVVGKTVSFQNKLFTVTGIMQDVPKNSSLQFDGLLPMSYYAQLFAESGGNGDWKTIDEDLGNFSFNTYVQLIPGVDPLKISNALTAAYKKARDGDSDAQFALQNLGEIHLTAADGNTSGLRMVRIFMLVVVLLLAIACINYVNLSTARALARAKEVGVRKVIGANKKQLFFQFVVETFLLFCLATVAAIVLIYLLMPLYNNISGKDLTFTLTDAGVWKAAGIAVVGTLLASSIYPALLLSSFNPIESIKGKVATGVGIATFRKALVVFQFAISVVLVVCTLVMSNQMRFIKNTDVGYDKSYVFSVPLTQEVKDHMEAVKTELQKQPGILNVAASDAYDITNVGSSTGDLDWPAKPAGTNLMITQVSVDKDFLPALKMKLVEGENFSGSPADSFHYILNETAVKKMELKKPYIGQQISFHEAKGTITGIVKDFNYQSLKETIAPLIFFTYRDNRNVLYVRTTAAQAQQAISATENQYKKYAGNVPFKYNFLDKSFEAHYKSDLRTSTLFNVFAAIAIFISCLGLFGLATYTAQVKKKEIGIRKVLGASVAGIVQLIGTDFLRLVVFAIVVAVPVAWWAMHSWLQGFAYRVNISWWIFVLSGGIAMAIALATISFQAIKAAIANPVKSLRSE